MTQLSNTTSTCEAKWKMWLLRVFVLIYLTTICGAQDEADETTQRPTTIYDPPEPNLQLKSDFSDVFTFERVILECSISSGSDWTLTWQKDGQPLSQNADFSFTDNNSLLTITARTQDLAGSYTCRGEDQKKSRNTEHSQPVVVKIKEPPTPTLKRTTPWSDVFDTEVLKFGCGVPSSEWTPIWYKDIKELINEGTTLEIASVTKNDAGKYTCKVQIKSRGVTSAPSNHEVITVYANDPKTTLIRRLDFDPLYVNEMIDLTCNVDVFSEWEFEWYKDGNKIPASSSSNHKITSVTLSNNGEYQCKVKRGNGPLYTSNNLSVKVSEPPTPTLKRMTLWSDVFMTEVLKFICGLPSSEWTPIWYKDQMELINEGTTLEIASIKNNDAGKYTCKVQIKSRGVTSGPSNHEVIFVYDNTPTSKLIRSTYYSTMYPGESITFTCSVNQSTGWEYEWYYKGVKTSSSTENTWTIPSLTLSNSGNYNCMAKRLMFNTTQSNPVSLEVSNIPVPSIYKTKWLDVFPSEEVELQCVMNKDTDWIFTWYNNTEEVTESLFNNNKVKDTLHITSASPSASGSYSCSGRLNGRLVSSGRSSEVKLLVYDTKPTVTLLKNPEDDLMHTSDFISFTCHINVSSGWSYLWYQDGSPLESTGNVHNISSAKMSQSGSYQCQVTRTAKSMLKSEKSQGLKLQIEERPKAKIILLTGWSEVFSTDTLKLQCEVLDSSDQWNYTWFKEDNQLSQILSDKHDVTPNNDPGQSLYTCQGLRNGRPNYSRPSDQFRTKNLLLKRRILLAISGCLFFGIIAVLLGCIGLRVFRKPVPVDDKQEDTNLFLTMAQLKDRKDAPCPLVGYITDADMNPPAKEGEDNDSCSETTPLPISSPEEQDVTTNGKEASGNGGAMVSFLH